jgi:hypothetical protein
VPHQNRVTPFGELIATPHRGLVYGNRGCLHDDQGRIRRASATKRWIACRLRFKDWQRSPLLQPGRFTELFFLDEVTAFAAGHRPCALCRRADYNRFGARFAALHPGVRGADAIDEQLDQERLAGSGRRLHRARLGTLPDGAFVVVDEEACLVLDGGLRPWTPSGYAPARAGGPAARHTVDVLTPPSIVEILRSGWDGAVPLLHPSATSAGRA